MEILDKQYWDNRYLSQQIGWDIGYVSTPLKQYFDTLTDKNISVLIPGGGNSYEVQYLLELGFTNVTVVDISEIVCQTLTEKYKTQGLKVVCQDFFQHEGKYDLIVEQTFFCALEPKLRSAYCQKMRTLLNTKGVLAGLLFNRTFEGGPPFGGTKEEYQQLFTEAGFEMIFDLHPPSIPARRGSEVFFRAFYTSLIE